MRILHIINDLATGGTEHLLVKHVQELSRQHSRFESEVVVLGTRETASREYLERLPSEPKCLGFSGRYRDPFGSTGCLRRLRQEIRAAQPDLVHSYLWNANVFTELARVQLGVPHMVHVVDRRGDRNNRRWVARNKVRLSGRLLSKRDVRFVAVSDACRMHAIEQWLVRPERIVTAHNGIPTQEFAGPPRSSIAGRVPVLGTISNFKEEKGHRVLLEAVRLLQDRGIDVQVKIAGGGRGADVEKLKEQTRSLGICGCVEFVGQVPSAADFYREIDLFVIPSIFAEGLPTTILEAMASGLAVLATNVGGAVEAVRDAVEGRIVPPRDPESIAGAVGELLADPRGLLEMGKAGQLRVGDGFTIQKMTATIVEQGYVPLIDAFGPRHGGTLGTVGQR